MKESQAAPVSRPETAHAAALESAAQEELLTRWQIGWIKFRKNRLAIAGGIVIAFFYLVMVILPGFVAPYGYNTKFENFVHASPMVPKFVDEEGRFHLRPFIYPLASELDMQTFTWIYTEDTSRRIPIYFFVRGEEYKFLGFIPTDLHLFGTTADEPILIFGTDRLGRDLFSRILHGGRISLTVGLVGVALTIILGTILGTISGFYGGTIDNVIQRIAEVLLSFPDIPLWAALAAAMPPHWTSVTTFFGISVILSLRNWTGLARQVRGKVLSMRESDFTMAAKSLGATDWWIISRHLIPNTLSHIIVIATLSIPGIILAETALSFLGLGIQPPMTSWGVLLQEAQQVSVVMQRPWLLIPGLFVVMAVLSFNFLGDGIRDAADPYSRE